MSKYWERRKAQDMFHYMAGAEQTADEISKLYLKASRQISLELDQIFERFQKKHHLSEAEARQMLNQMRDRTSLDELKEVLRQGEGDKAELLAELESPAYQARMERLQQLQNQIDLTMQQVYGQEKIKNTSWYLDLANEAYYRSVFTVQQQTGLAFGFNLVSAETIDRVVNSRWSGKNYSDRIWSNTRALAQDLKEELLVNLVTGRTERETADIIANKFAQGAGNARRLVRTESCNLAAQMDMQSYKECGIRRYRFVAVLDLKTSNICRELDGKVFPVSEQQPGENCPPMHPWCRSTTISIIAAAELKSMKRKARNPVTGKAMEVPADMTYQKWYEKYVQGRPEAELNEKKIKNRASDRAQYKRYKKLLGDDAPEKLDDFQQMKYTDTERWSYTKLDYKRRSDLLEHPEKRLQNAEKVMLPEGKFTNYLFGGNNEDGLPKGRNFDERLGYNIDNWKLLQKEISRKALEYPAVFKGNAGFGEKYEQKMILYGLKGKPANVVVGWIRRPDETVSMTSAYIKEV